MKIVKLTMLAFVAFILTTNLMAQQATPAATPEKTAPTKTVAPVPPVHKDTLNPPSPMGMTEHRVMMLKDRLKLTDDQTAKVRAILTDSEKQAQVDREKSKGNPEESRKAAMARHKANDEKIMVLLNAEQKKEYQKMIEEPRGKDKMKMGNKPPAEGKK